MAHTVAEPVTISDHIKKAIQCLKEAQYEIQEASIDIENAVRQKQYAGKPIELHELVQMQMVGNLFQLRNQIDDAASSARRHIKTIRELDLGV